MSEINKREILELMKLEGNNKCADCGKKGERSRAWKVFDTIIKPALCTPYLQIQTGLLSHSEHSCAGIVAEYTAASAFIYQK